MKKKIISILLALALCVGSFSAFVSCDSKEGNETDSGSDTGHETVIESDDVTESGSKDESDTEADTSNGETETESSSDTVSETESVSEDTSVSESESESESSSESESVGDGEETTECYHPYAADFEGHWKPACDKCGKGEGRHQQHEYEERVEDEGDLLVYAFRCTVCKFKAYEQEVPYEINAFYGAGDLSYTDASGKLKGEFKFEAGVGFASYSSEEGGSSTVVVVSNGEVGDSSGRYLVMKVRLPASQSSFSASIKSVGAYKSQSMLFKGLKSGWVTIIVDVTKAATVQSVKDDATGITADRQFGYHPMGGEYYLGDFRFTATAGAGESFDVAYVMMCETLEDAENFTANEKTRIIYEDILNEAPKTDSQQCVDENGNPIVHKYTINDDGTHTITESCYQCGLVAVENEPHAYAQTIDENGDYTYACGACGHSKYGATINKYIDSEEIDTAGLTYYMLNKLGITVDPSGFDYSSYSGQGTTAQIIYTRTGFNEIEEATAFTVGKGNMFIIRMRTNSPTVDFSIRFGTSGASGTTLQFPTKVAGDEWATYVVDLSAVIPGSYVADSKGEYLITNFYPHIGGVDGGKHLTSEVVYDIDFMAFVDQWSEVGVLTPDEKVISVTGANVGGWVTTADKGCVGEHSYTVKSEGDKHTVQCGSCGYVLKEYNVPGAKTFYPAEVLADIGRTFGTVDRTLMNDTDGASFVRLDNMKTNGVDAGNWMGWEIFASSTGYDIGRYMVIKIRVGENGLGQSNFKFYTGTSQSVSSEKQSISFKVSEDDQWHTVVIDIRERIVDPDTYMVPDENGNYMIKALQLRPFSNNQPGAQPDDYMDVEYIAFCDDLKELKNIIKESTYEWSADSSTSPERNTADHSCYTHSLNDFVEGETHTVKCTSCGETIKAFTVPENINWFSSFNQMVSYQHKLDKFLYDEEADVIYNRFTGNGGNHLNITGGDGAGAADTATFTAGQYFVMKYRATASSGTLKLKVSSNGVVGNVLSVSLGERGYTQFHKDWTVVVIDLSDISSCYEIGAEGNLYVMLTSGGNYTVDIAYVAIADNIDEVKGLLAAGETYVDLGKTWSPTQSGGDEGGDDGEDESGTTPTPPVESEHSITETVSDGENGAKVYTYTCSHCNMNVTKTVPATVFGYFSAGKIANEAPSYHQLGSHKIASDNGDVFARFVGADKVAQALWLRVQEDCNSSTTTGTLGNAPNINVENSKYLVIRARSNNSNQPFKINISTTGKNSPTATSVNGTEGKYNIEGGDLAVGDTYATASGYVGIKVPLNATKAGEWRVYVIDLTSVVSEYYVKDTETQTYILDTFFFHFDSFASTTSLDIGYVGFVESWEDISDMVSETAVMKITSVEGDYAIVSTLDGSCADHSAELVVKNGKYVSVCSACGETIADYGIKAEAVGGFLSAEALTNGGVAFGSFDKEYKVENGVQFLRLSNSKPGPDNWTGFTVINTDAKSYVGQYMVIKFRIGQNGLGQSYLSFYASTKKGALVSQSLVSIQASEDDQWHTVVVDLSQRIASPSTHFIAEDGAYNVRYLQIRPFSGNQGGAQVDDYMDISYIAFCDSLGDLEGIVGATYEWSASTSQNIIRDTATGECATHGLSEAVNGNTYSYKCNACDQTVKTLTVPEGVTVYYSANDIAKNAGVYYNVNGGKDGVKSPLCSDASGEAYAAVTGTNGSASQILFMRVQEDFTQATNANLVGLTKSVGEAKYFVIRIRTNDPAEQMRIDFSTTGKNGTPDGDDANTFPDSVGYASVIIPLSATDKDGWATYVIDLEAVISEHYVKVGGEYVIDTLYFHFDSFALESQIDIAYMAFAEDLDAVDALAGGEEIVDITSKKGDFQKYSAAIKKKIELIYNAAIGNDTIKSGLDGREYIVSDANGDAFVSYLKALGYTEVDTDAISGAKFDVSILRKGNDQFAVYYNRTSGELRVIHETASSATLAPLAPNSSTGTGSVEIAQIGMTRVNETDNPLIGMCYVVKLSDGSAIIIDGGLQNEACADNLFLALGDMGIAQTNGKYRIAAWIITHCHADHNGTAKKFAEKYSDRAVVEYLVQSFPGDNNVAVDGGDEAGFVSAFKSAFPSVTVISAHAGLNYYFGNATVEMLYTPELLYTMDGQLDYYNNTSLIFKISAGGSSVLFLGDAAENAANVTWNSYDAGAFEADVFQLTHHGLYTGANEGHTWVNLGNIYRATGAKYAFLPMHQRNGVGSNVKNGRYDVMIYWASLGLQMSYVMNETDTHGQSQITQAYFEDFEASVAAGTNTHSTLYGYDGVNKIVSEDGLVTYMGSTTSEPMITVFTLANGEATLKLNEKLSK